MRRAVLVIVLALAACSPAAALAAGWKAAQIRPLHGRIVPLTSVIRDQHARTEIIETETTRALAAPADVLFAFGSARVTPAGEHALDALAPQLPAGPVTVAGHTDARGTTAYNERLAARRADAVARIMRKILTADLRVASRSMGERHPVASNRTAAGRRRNRRVELVVPR